MAEISIRQYRPADQVACRVLWAELTVHHQELYDDPGIGGDDPGSGFDQYMENPDLQGPWVAVKGGAVVGLAGLLVKGREAEVEPVIVSQHERRQGIGRRLINRVKVEADRLEIRFLDVRPVARNASAIAFFVGAGFGIVGHIDLFQDLAPSKERRWQDGITIHGHSLRF